MKNRNKFQFFDCKSNILFYTDKQNYRKIAQNYRICAKKHLISWDFFLNHHCGSSRKPFSINLFILDSQKR